MSSDRQDNQGTHYHYHFYGPGAPQQPYPGAQPGSPEGFPEGFPRGPDARAGDGGPYAAGGPFTAGPGAANAHQHPTADSFVKGLLVGAGAAYLLTNETAQRTILRTAVQLWTVVQGGFEELKERLHDAEAEVAGADAADDGAPASGSASTDAQPAAGSGDDLTINTGSTTDGLTINTASGSDNLAINTGSDNLTISGNDGSDDLGTVTITPGHRFPRTAS